MPPRAAYVHVPFCRRRCGYCNFTVVAGRDDLQEAYQQAIERELSSLGRPRDIDTLFLGGGTPSQLGASGLIRLGKTLRRWLVPAVDCEFTVEVNPEDVRPELLDALAAMGANRVSLGIQSLDDGKLQRLERCHDRTAALTALQLCRDRFPSVAVDLIFAAPREDLVTWRSDLAGTVAAGADHVSAYGMTLERGSAFWGRWRKGRLQTVTEEAERAMFEAAIDLLTGAGYEHYEVSNFARPGHRCRHNETYWNGGQYWAFGPGASRHVDGWRETNHRSTTTYLRRVLAGRSPVADREHLPPEARARERLVFQMRMLEGVSHAAFHAETGFELDRLLGDLLPCLAAAGLWEDTGDRLRLTREGLMVSDAIWSRVLDASCAGESSA